MKVLITGHSGFVGSHFTRAYLDAGHRVHGIDTVNYGGDVRTDLPHDSFDLAIHCAANVGGRAAIDNSRMWVAENLAIDHAFIQWAAKHAERTVLFSSSAAYPLKLQGDSRWGLDVTDRLTEQDIDPLNPQEPDNSYGWCKMSMEHMARWAGLDALILRPFSGYSHTQPDTYPFSAILGRARRREDPLQVWSDTVRDFIHIDDIVGATLALLAADQTGPFNLCTGVPTSFTELARMAADQVGYDPKLQVLGKHPGALYRVGDPTKLRQFYEPVVTLQEGIARGLAQ